MTSEEDLKAEMEAERRAEHQMEYEQELRDEALHAYITDNKSELALEFAEDNEDDFRAYCKEAFKDLTPFDEAYPPRPR